MQLVSCIAQQPAAVTRKLGTAHGPAHPWFEQHRARLGVLEGHRYLCLRLRCLPVVPSPTGELLLGLSPSGTSKGEEGRRYLLRLSSSHYTFILSSVKGIARI